MIGVTSFFRDPEVFVTRENGVVEQPQLVRRGATGFAARIGCLKHQGRQQVEVTAIDATGSTVLANFPVWCHADAPAAIALGGDQVDPPVTSAEDALARAKECRAQGSQAVQQEIVRINTLSDRVTALGPTGKESHS